MRKNKKRVLIVDDEAEVCKAICAYLKRRKFEVCQAYNGIQALEVIKKTEPDLILLDVVMPQMDGFEVLQRLKSESVYSKIPVIMLTTKSEPKNLNKGIALKADFYLPKPFTFDNLMSFINLILKCKE